MIKGKDDNLLKKYNDILSSNRSYKKPSKLAKASSFIVGHYAGEVEYEVASFLEKNNDTISDVINDCLFGSKSTLLSNLFIK